MVSEDSAVALAADVILALAARGHDVPLARVNCPRLVRLAALMLAELGADGGSHHVTCADTMAPGNS